MKRHQSLHPLSHDHHHALVQALNLHKAGASGDQASFREAAARFVGFWKSDLQRHFAQEEQVVLPQLAKYKAADATEIRETLEQHSAIVRMIGELNEKLELKEDAIEASLIANLAEALRRHIRYEESKLFPDVESSVPEEELWLMNMRLSDR
ncbi:MAG: hemerythrin domain-containing protein [Chloracidobacterium sp.]|nr:hemerythrin domain-containing protein [Chloracidobacterium sp.]